MRSGRRVDSGAALVLVLLVLLVFLAVGAFALVAVDRNAEMQAAYQRSVAGFNAAEAVVNYGAARVRNIFLAFNFPGDEECQPRQYTINERVVEYRLSVPGRPAGDCRPGELRQVRIPAGNPFEGLNAQVYTYDLRASARHRGETEAVVNLRFDTYLIPLFQFAAFYGGDLELTVGPPMVVNGRMHANQDMYLNTEDCDPGLRVLGQVTVRKDLYRGRKDANTNYGRIRISLDGSPTNLRHLGIRGPEDSGCVGNPGVARRRVPPEEVVLFQGRVRDDAENIRLPDPGLNCAPWSCEPGTREEDRVYWNRADLRIVLDARPGQERQLQPGVGPALWPVVVVDRAGNVDGTKTEALRQLMLRRPGVITYTDVPISGWNCANEAGCEANYADPDNYAPRFPVAAEVRDAYGCREARGRRPRDALNGIPTRRTDGALEAESNYCNDYRYGGFYNWRERKPLLVLNVDWMALDEWNRQNGSPLWNPGDTTDGGLVVFLSVRGPNSDKANNYAVRIYDAQRLTFHERDSGVTFASDVALYVAGNFNCADPEESVRDSTDPMPCGPGDRRDRTVGKRPSSLVGDTLNVLSCAWVSQVWEEGGPGDDPWNASGPCRREFRWGRWERMLASWGSPDCVDPARGESGGACPYRPRDERSTTGSASGHPSRRTVVNAAFLAGNDATWCPSNPRGVDCNSAAAGPWYSGGLENYPRFHECWASCNTGGADFNGRFWYEGSFVALSAPRHTCFAVIAGLRPEDPGSSPRAVDDPAYPCLPAVSTPYPGFWKAQRYQPPQRRWFYDVSFDDARNLPPLTPRFLFLVQNFFTEEFR
jgi:hypothetical protein